MFISIDLVFSILFMEDIGWLKVVRKLYMVHINHINYYFSV